MKTDILAFGAHPDDVEMGCGGTIAKSTASGKTVGIIDLTRGELGTNGTPELRDKEANSASKIIGAKFRINLGFFQETQGFTIFSVTELLALLGTISIVYGAIVTLRQTDLKRLIAYSSISHMGYVLLGFSAISKSGEFSLYSLKLEKYYL